MTHEQRELVERLRNRHLLGDCQEAATTIEQLAERCGRLEGEIAEAEQERDIARARATGWHTELLQKRDRNLELCDRIADLESALTAERTRREGLEARIRDLEACVLEYWYAKDWDAVGAADATAAKLLPADMRARAALKEGI
jgi:chromosome segregation ATPase